MPALGAALTAVAGVAVASLVPGLVAVVHERRAHRSAVPAPHRTRTAVLLLAAGLVVNTAGTVGVLLRIRRAPGSPDRRTAIALDLVLLGAGDLIGVPYLALVRALHR